MATEENPTLLVQDCAARAAVALDAYFQIEDVKSRYGDGTRHPDDYIGAITCLGAGLMCLMREYMKAHPDVALGDGFHPKTPIELHAEFLAAYLDILNYDGISDREMKQPIINRLARLFDVYLAAP